MMQSCASAAKLRGGGPILCYGVISMQCIGSPPPRTVIGYRHKLDGLGLLRRAQNDAVRHHALSHEPPQGDRKLARQGHDHGLTSAASILGAGSKPLHHGAVLLEYEKSPSQLDHASSNSSVARTGQSFLAALLPAGTSYAIISATRAASCSIVNTDDQCLYIQVVWMPLSQTQGDDSTYPSEAARCPSVSPRSRRRCQRSPMPPRHRRQFFCPYGRAC
jgi:hypothetical protein